MEYWQYIFRCMSHLNSFPIPNVDNGHISGIFKYSIMLLHRCKWNIVELDLNQILTLSHLKLEYSRHVTALMVELRVHRVLWSSFHLEVELDEIDRNLDWIGDVENTTRTQTILISNVFIIAKKSRTHKSAFSSVSVRRKRIFYKCKNWSLVRFSGLNNFF